MGVEILERDRLDGLADTGEVVDQPNWPDIEEAVRALDGEVRTLVNLVGAGEAFLAIGGGNEGLYLVNGSEIPKTSAVLLSPDATRSEMVELVVGGQDGEFPAKRCVNLETALRAARTFFEHGQLDRSFSWEMRDWR